MSEEESSRIEDRERREVDKQSRSSVDFWLDETTAKIYTGWFVGGVGCV